MTTDKLIKIARKCGNRTTDCEKECPFHKAEDCTVQLINELADELERAKTEKDNLIKTYSECQVDNIKEFAERLKDNSFYTLGDLKVVDIKDINNLVKEMVGAENDKT